MSLNWNWDNKIGELQLNNYGEQLTISIYKGNAPMIFIREYKKESIEYYELYTFFNDIQHIKNIIKYENEYFKNWKLLTMYKTDSKTIKFCELIYKQGVEVKLTHKENNTNENI